MKFRDIKKYLVPPDITIFQAIGFIQKGGKEIAVVVDKNNNMLGTVTDGDIRRGILKHIDLSERVSRIMNLNPSTILINTPKEELKLLFLKTGKRQLIVVNEKGTAIQICFLKDLLQESEEKDTIVFILAGGQGKRLRPLTNDTPKPLLSVGNKPILVTIIEQLEKEGLKNIILSVNYHAEKIKNHLKDGKQYGVRIEYQHEKSKLGTAGSLYHFKERVKEKILVMNGDILTKVNFRQLLDYHDQEHADISICTKKYDFKYPFGVVETQEHIVKEITEKPVNILFINAGIYVVGARSLKNVENENPLDMPDLINRCIEKGNKVISFPIHEYWVDIGNITDYEFAKECYSKIF